MQPALQPGDVLSVQGSAPEEVRAGDILVLIAREQNRVHRLLRLSKTTDGWKVLTKGDNSLSADPEWAAQGFVARVIAIQRGERQLDLRRGSLRLAGRLIANLSALQLGCSGARLTLGQRLLYKATSWLIGSISRSFYRFG